MRHVLIAVLYEARVASGTFVDTQLSYAVRKLSHSAIPIFSCALAVVLVFVAGVLAGAAEFVLAGATLRFVSDLAQASTRRPVKIHNIKRRDFDIIVLRFAGWQSAQIIHLFRSLCLVFGKGEEK